MYEGFAGVYDHMMEEIREAIEAGTYQEYKKRKLSGMEKK